MAPKKAAPGHKEEDKPVEIKETGNPDLHRQKLAAKAKEGDALTL